MIVAIEMYILEMYCVCTSVEHFHGLAIIHVNWLGCGFYMCVCVYVVCVPDLCGLCSMCAWYDMCECGVW